MVLHLNANTCWCVFLSQHSDSNAGAEREGDRICVVGTEAGGMKEKLCQQSRGENSKKMFLLEQMQPNQLKA